MSDNNLVSLAGDGSGIVWITRGDAPAELLFAASDLGIREVFLGDLVAQPGTADVLKLSGVTRLLVNVRSIDARLALEDAIDVNHSRDCTVIVSDLYAAQTYCGTIKGGSSGVRIVVGRQYGHGKQTDWDFGGFADQSNARTTGCALHVDSADLSPVRVRLLTADAPTLENTGSSYVTPQRYEITKLNQGWFYPLFNLLKDFLAMFKIKI